MNISEGQRKDAHGQTIGRKNKQDHEMELGREEEVKNSGWDRREPGSLFWGALTSAVPHAGNLGPAASGEQPERLSQTPISRAGGSWQEMRAASKIIYTLGLSLLIKRSVHLW